MPGRVVGGDSLLGLLDSSLWIRLVVRPPVSRLIDRAFFARISRALADPRLGAGNLEIVRAWSLPWRFLYFFSLIFLL